MDFITYKKLAMVDVEEHLRKCNIERLKVKIDEALDNRDYDEVRRLQTEIEKIKDLDTVFVGSSEW